MISGWIVLLVIIAIPVLSVVVEEWVLSHHQKCPAPVPLSERDGRAGESGSHPHVSTDRRPVNGVPRPDPKSITISRSPPADSPELSDTARRAMMIEID